MLARLGWMECQQTWMQNVSILSLDPFSRDPLQTSPPILKELKPKREVVTGTSQRAQIVQKLPHGLETVPYFAGSHVKFIGKRSALSCVFV